MSRDTWQYKRKLSCLCSAVDALMRDWLTVFSPNCFTSRHVHSLSGSWLESNCPYPQHHHGEASTRLSLSSLPSWPCPHLLSIIASLFTYIHTPSLLSHGRTSTSTPLVDVNNKEVLVKKANSRAHVLYSCRNAFRNHLCDPACLPASCPSLRSPHQMTHPLVPPLFSIMFHGCYITKLPSEYLWMGREPSSSPTIFIRPWSPMIEPWRKKWSVYVHRLHAHKLGPLWNHFW